MIKRILVSATLATAIATFTFVGCGGSSSNNPGASGDDSGPGNPNKGDSGGVGTPNPDGGAPITDGAATGNPPLPDGSIYPHGTLLVPGSALVLNGVTSDDYVIYTDESSATANAVYALSLTAGSKPISIGSADANDDVYVVGKIVFIGTSSDKNGVGAASVWTSGATAAASLSTSTFVEPPVAAVSADGTKIAFLDAVDETANTAAIAVAGADGTGEATLVPTLDLSDVCFPELDYAGAYVVAAYCLVGDAGAPDSGEPDGGTNPYIGNVTSFAGPTAWTATSIATSAQTVFARDNGATKVAINGTTGTVVFPIAGGTGVPIDATGEIGAFTFSPGIFTKDGSHLLYTTNAQALERAATTAPASPLQLAAPGKFADIFNLSPDENWTIGSLNADSQGSEVDLYLSSATTAGAPVTLSGTPTASFGNAPFTADSSHVLFMAGVNGGLGTLTAVAVTGAGTPTTLGTNAALNIPTSAAKVVFNSNYGGAGGQTNAADLQAVDTSTTAAPTVLVTQADPNFSVNSEKTLIVYTWSYTPGASAGLWTLAAP
jgi:hypothetical protein